LPDLIRQCVWVPAKYCNKETSQQAKYPDAYCYPVPDRRGISMNKPVRPAYEKPAQKIRIEVRDFSLDEAMPQHAARIDAQIECDDAGDDLVKEKPHSNIRSSTKARRAPSPRVRGEG
jgi:hypothetical protein